MFSKSLNGVHITRHINNISVNLVFVDATLASHHFPFLLLVCQLLGNFDIVACHLSWVVTSHFGSLAQAT